MAVSTAGRSVTVHRVETHASSQWALLVLRVVLGVIFLIHGGQKAFGWFGGPGMPGAVGMMGHMGVPPFLAYVAVYTELIGGILLVVGLLSRIAAIGIAIDMVVAIALVHGKNGFFNTPPNLGFEYNLALIAMCVAVLIGGPGALGLADEVAPFIKRPESEYK